MPIVKMPDGTQVRFPDEMPKEQIRDMILRKFPDAGNPAPQGDGEQPSPAFQDALAKIRAGAPGAVSEASQPGMAEMSGMTTGFQNAPQEDTDRLVRANLEASKIQEMQGDKGLLRRAAEAIPGGATGGFADEAYSGTVGAGARMLRDGVGYGEAYKREQALAAAQKRKRGDAANIIGDVAGGLGLGGALTKGGVTLTGRATSGLGKMAAASGEGAAYGGLYGAGNAEEGHRLEEAGTGALLGAATGLGAEVLGSGISRLASKAKQPTTVAPTIDELAQATDDFYARSRAAGVTIKQPAFDNLANNMQLAAGRINKDLRPKTAGIIEDVMALKGKNVTLEELDELRQVVGQSMKRAEPQDVRTLTRMKTIIDSYEPKAGDTTGDIRGFEFIKEGRKLAARKAKAETIETIVENAKNSASGFENGVINEFRSLARNPKRMGKFSKEEQKMVRGLIRRANVHGGLRAIGYLSPKSPLGAAVLGAMGIGSGIVPAAMVAGTGMASRAAATALTRGKLGNLQAAVANGSIPQLPQLPNYLRPAIGGLTAGTTGLALPRSAR